MTPTTHHALYRYREHWPLAEVEDVSAAYEAGTVLDPELVRLLCGRRSCYPGSTYRAAPDMRGIFAVSDGCIVTYLRMGAAQVAVPRPAPPHSPVAPANSTFRNEDRRRLASLAKYEARRLAELEARYLTAETLPDRVGAGD